MGVGLGRGKGGRAVTGKSSVGEVDCSLRKLSRLVLSVSLDEILLHWNKELNIPKFAKKKP